MTEDTIRVIKDRDHWKHSVEIKENAKGETLVTVKSRSEDSAEDAGIEAVKEFKRIKGELAK